LTTTEVMISGGRCCD